MSSAALARTRAGAAGVPWGTWGRQIGAILRMEISKHFLSRRGWWIYLIALAPTILFGMHAIYMANRGRVCNTGADTITYSWVFQFLYVRFAIFLGCAGIFMNLFRGEMLEKSLHYYFLAPVRREVLVAGKYLSGLIAACILFGLSTLASLAILYGHFGAERARNLLFEGPGLEHVFAYLGVTLLACVGYGAVFTIMGQTFTNPMLPAALVLVWEGLNPFLPGLLKKISVIFYLKSMMPVEAAVRGPLAILVVTTDPLPAWICVTGLVAVSMAAMVLACWKARTMEINYGTD
jgi:ABC-type transport system involved in multi-copper enzyme maturation permease subunit